jgi:DNA-binding response OmpR family regulator
VTQEPAFGVERTTALVVDDEFYIVDLLADILADEGFRVLRAYDGLSALAIAEETQVDLVVADVMMPKLDGIALALRLRQRYAAMRIVLMSAAVTQVPAGFEFIAKPFDINELLEKLESTAGR